MNRKFLILLVLIAIFTQSCKSSDSYKNKMEVLVHFHNDYDSNEKTDTAIRSIIAVDDSIKYIYNLENEICSYSYISNIQSDSSIWIYNHNCPLLASKTYRIKNQEFIVKKYYYDKLNVIDEETSFFINKNYGLLVVYNNGWSDLINTLEYDLTSKTLIDSIINDRSGFYKGGIPIPPPPPEYEGMTIEYE